MTSISTLCAARSQLWSVRTAPAKPVFNLLTGALRADAGTIRLQGQDVRGLSPDVIARKGIVRSFQNVRLFGRMSALENVMLGNRGCLSDRWRWPSGTRGGENLADLFLLPGVAGRVECETRERALEWLRLVGLGGVADTPAGALSSFGQQKLVSFARLLGSDADVLLLDEPASGIDFKWVDSVLELVAFMRDSGKTVSHRRAQHPRRRAPGRYSVLYGARAYHGTGDNRRID